MTGCSRSSCQTHPALCPGRKCPDYRDGGKAYISLDQSINHERNKAHSCSCDRRGVRGDRSPQRPETELAGVCSAKTENSRSEQGIEKKKNRQPELRTLGRRGSVQ